MSVIYQDDQNRWRYGISETQSLGDVVCVSQAVAVELQLAMEDVGELYNFSIHANTGQAISNPVVQSVTKV